MTGKAAKAYVAACLLVFAVSLCLLVYQGRKGVQAEEASDLSAETTEDRKITCYMMRHWRKIRC